MPIKDVLVAMKHYRLSKKGISQMDKWRDEAPHMSYEKWKIVAPQSGVLTMFMGVDSGD